MLGNASEDKCHFTFLGAPIGRQCLCSVLSIGKNRLRKVMNLVPDGRIGRDKTGSHEATYGVDAFLSLKYANVAETLPDRPGAKKSLKHFVASMFDPVW